jgi:trehalose-6-phosphatase
VIISGRAREDLARRIGNVPVFHLSGNYGLEPWAQSEQYARRVRRWVGQLSARLAPFPGIVIEDKSIR